MLGEILRRRQVCDVVWFHADHWEPWGGGAKDISLKKVERFTNQARLSSFGRKMTLFYLSGTQYRIKGSSVLQDSQMVGELLEAVPLTEQDDQKVRQVIGELKAQTNVEFQVHVHHERLLSNDGDWGVQHGMLKSLTDPEQDERRLHFLMTTELERIRRHTGAPLKKWAFVHGLWALNGSDRTVCHVDNEIEILMQHGCWGDFSFPAGRGHCDPVNLEQPYTCVPFTAPKCYDQPNSLPIAIDVGAGAITDDRFLIWNSRTKQDSCSIDYYGEGDRERLKNTDRIVLAWLSGCPVIDHTLYIKTHAHSVRSDYFEEGYLIPIAYPDVQALFNRLQSACDEAKVELTAASVNEVLARLKKIDSLAGVVPDVPATNALSSCVVRDIRLDGGGELDQGMQPSFELTELVAVSILHEWLSIDPEANNAAGSYYIESLSRNRLLRDADLAIAKYCQSNFLHETRFFELGFGFGELSLLLALCGFTVTGFEGDVRRYAAGIMLTKALAERGANLGTLTLVEGLFPEALDLRSLRAASNALVSSNVTHSYIMENIDFVYRALRLFDHLILDLAQFGRARDPASRQKVAVRLQQCGFVEVGRVFSASTNDVRHFRRGQGAAF